MLCSALPVTPTTDFNDKKALGHFYQGSLFLPGGYIIDDTLSTKFATELTAFFIVFWVLAELLFMVATVPATMLPTAMATPKPFIIFTVFFFIFVLRY
jgi:hypothetical protein